MVRAVCPGANKSDRRHFIISLRRKAAYMKYEIFGDPFPAVTCDLNDGEAMITEGGAMIWMTPNMEMQTSGGGIGKVFSRAFSGENLFQNIYTARGDGSITFGASFPGKILPVEITPGCDLIAQKRSFLASEQGVELSVFFNKKFMTGFFGGEGFIMQRLSGQGMAFLEIDGALKEFVLEPGQQMIVDTGNVAAFESTVKMEVVSVKGIKNKLLGGEGFFNTVLTGPGKIWLQTLPIAGVAMEIYNLIPHSN